MFGLGEKSYFRLSSVPLPLFAMEIRGMAESIYALVVRGWRSPDVRATGRFQDKRGEALKL